MSTEAMIYALNVAQNSMKDASKLILELKAKNKALEEALAQDMPKIGCVNHDCDKCKEQKQKRPQNCGTGYCSCIDCVMDEQDQGKPVAWISKGGLTELIQSVRTEVYAEQDAECLNTIPLYTTPQPKQEQGEPVTDEQVQDAIDAWFKPDRNGHYTNTFQERMRAAIEAAHGIKENT